MTPPWLKFPHIPPRSVGSRMGEGEQYQIAFNEWFARKHAEAKTRYADDHPEPDGWEGFYDRRRFGG